MRSLRRFPPVLLVLAILVALGGCKPDDDDDSSAGDDDTTSSAILSVEVDVSELIGAVVTVSWETLEPTAGRVEFGLDDSFGRQVVDPGDDTTDHEVILLGLTTETEYAYRVVALDGDVEVGAESGSFTTGPLPPELAGGQIANDVPHPELTAGGFFAVPLFSQVSIPVILDAKGNPVWWHVDEVPHETITTVHLTRDRTGVIYNAFHMDDGDDIGNSEERILRVSLDGRTVERIEALQHSHNFVELPDGTLGYIATDHVEIEGETVRGDKIIELQPDGTEEQVWSVWDYFEYDPELEPPTGTGFTHANALDYIEAEDAYYLSLRSQDCVLKVDRATAQVEWVLGGPYTTLDIAGTDPHSDQHQFHVFDDHLLIFDNGDVSRYASRAVEYVLDHGAGSAEMVWEHYSDPVVYIISGGDVSRLPSGHTLVTWSSAGQMDEVDEDGELIWRLNTPVGLGFGFTEWIEDIDAR